VEQVMDWGSLIGPAAVAAGISGVISIVSMVVTTRPSRQLHSEKLRVDQKLAEQVSSVAPQSLG
jgi:hypothetical protein